MKKKKIIFVHQALWIGGIETALVNLLNRMDYDKYDVTCLILQDDLKMADSIPKQCRLLVADRYNLVSFNKKYKFSKLYDFIEEPTEPSGIHKKLMKFVPIVKWIENRLYIRYIKSLMGEEKFETAVIYSDRTAEITVRAVSADKYLMFYHHGAMRHVYHDKIGYKKSEKIIAVSENLAEELRMFVPQYKHKIISIHNIVDTNYIIRQSDEIIVEFERDKFNIVSCGRLAYEKGMDIAIKTCTELVGNGFTNIKWWIIGGGPEEEKLKKMIEELNVSEYIKMIGMMANPYPYMKNADLYVQPSRIESFGLTILEAMVLKVPVVSTDTAGAREILEDGITGILCPIDAKEIAKKIKYLLDNKYIIDELRCRVKSKDCDTENINILKKIESLL